MATNKEIAENIASVMVRMETLSKDISNLSDDVRDIKKDLKKDFKEMNRDVTALIIDKGVRDQVDASSKDNWARVLAGSAALGTVVVPLITYFLSK